MFDRKTQFTGRRIRAAAATAALLAPAVLVACGSNDESADAGGMSLSIAEPAKDATVSLPFTVKVDAGVPLGPTESGKHHVHLWLDNHANDYLVVESDTAEITSGQKATLSGKPLGVSPGTHTIHVSLRNANHSAAGVDTEMTIKVGTGTGAAPTTTAPSEPETSSEDPYDY
ncbi:hypothetical protein E0H73_38755 [Kribbella pittospori]|uniref:DUF4399 domain-containing protein n=1 Tax=Kribbella pittospori TaxID=722689 RepID=A0A4R0K6C7_9ACTN|nr:hypothetical protein [Kribbella pittospori]TCC54394.1 hypothetical protein E0H73_38755 [Kribbella pittospori]